MGDANLCASGTTLDSSEASDFVALLTSSSYLCKNSLNCCTICSFEVSRGDFCPPPPPPESKNTIVGADGAGVGIYEDITLDVTLSTTPVDGIVQFTTVAGAYMVDGAVLGAQSVTITDDDPQLICTIANATSEIACDIPGDTLEAYCNLVDITGPNADATFITLVGYLAATPATLTAERLTLDAATPSFAASAAPYRQITRICLGEFTNAGAATVVTDADFDPPERIQGRCITPGVYLGLGAIQLA